MTGKFIVTPDVDTANKLRAKGFREIRTGSKAVFTFENSIEKLNFSSDIDIKKIKYSNLLTF